MVLADRPWAPAQDDELMWFRPRSILPARPRPLDFTLEVHGVSFALTRALVSLNFPLYEVRARLFGGELYFASVPSGLFEIDPDAKMRLLWDASLRFTRSIRTPWEREVRREVEGYSSWMSSTAKAAGSASDLAEQFRRLRRLRGSQWYAMMRAVVGPLAMLRRQLAELPADSPDRPTVAAGADDGTAVLRDALTLVREQGTVQVDGIVELAAQRLTDAGVLGAIDDVRWLEWGEVRRALTEPEDWQARVADRKAAALTAPERPAEIIGPPLPPNASHMYLVREVLDLLAA